MDSDNIKALETSIQRLPTSSRDFARSLISQYHNRGFLSDKQWHWVRKLVEDNEECPSAAYKRAQAALKEYLRKKDR